MKTDNAKILGDAVVLGNAVVSDNAVVSGNAWVSDNAVVLDNAKVSDNAVVLGNAVVSDNAAVSGNAWVSGDAIIEKTSDYLTLGPAKSSHRFTTAHKDAKIGVRVNTGCFSGSVAEFEAAIEETHKENAEYLEQYRAFVLVIKTTFDLR